VRTQVGIKPSKMLRISFSTAADVIGAESAAGKPVGPRARASIGSRATVDAIGNRFGEDAVQRSRLLSRARVVRDQIAFGNTGHPADTRSVR
jgi:hypothetical protein